MAVKYQTLYKYLPCNENSIKPLTEGTLKYTNCIEFNDPFDCSPNMYTDEGKEFSVQMKSRVLAFGRMNKLSPAQRLERKSELLRKTKKIVNQPEYFQQKIASGFGVLSLSETATNILMWSHYANNHKGYILKLLSPVSGSAENASIVNNGGFELISYPVEYTNLRPKIKYPIDDQVLRRVFIKAVTSKAPDWSYEKEMRVVDHKRGPGIHSYNRKTCLAGVILGARISEKWKRRIKSIIETMTATCEQDLTIEQARLSQNDFKIHIEKS